jgi:hypothetical protein
MKFISSPDSWDIIWQQTFDATNVLVDRIFSPTQSDSPLIAVAVAVNNTYWKKQAVGYFHQHVESGLIGFNKAIAKSRTLYESELYLIPLDIVGNSIFSFDLFLKVAATGEIVVYEYTGDIN